MSMEALWAFREQTSSDPALGDEVRAELAKPGNCDLAAVARRHGFDVTNEEIQQGWAEVRDGELTPFELDLVSAGWGGVSTANSGAVQVSICTPPTHI